MSKKHAGTQPIIWIILKEGIKRVSYATRNTGYW
jgi:hypothetical protein